MIVQFYSAFQFKMWEKYRKLSQTLFFWRMSVRRAVPPFLMCQNAGTYSTHGKVHHCAPCAPLYTIFHTLNRNWSLLLRWVSKFHSFILHLPVATSLIKSQNVVNHSHPHQCAHLRVRNIGESFWNHSGTILIWFSPILAHFKMGHTHFSHFKSVHQFQMGHRQNHPFQCCIPIWYCCHPISNHLSSKSPISILHIHLSSLSPIWYCFY